MLEVFAISIYTENCAAVVIKASEKRSSVIRFINPSEHQGLSLSKTLYPHCHIRHKLWAEICAVWPIFKGDLIKFCEILTKITLKLYKNSLKPIFKCQNSQKPLFK